MRALSENELCQVSGGFNSREFEIGVGLVVIGALAVGLAPVAAGVMIADVALVSVGTAAVGLGAVEAALGMEAVGDGSYSGVSKGDTYTDEAF